MMDISDPKERLEALTEEASDEFSSASSSDDKMSSKDAVTCTDTDEYMSCDSSTSPTLVQPQHSTETQEKSPPQAPTSSHLFQAQHPNSPLSSSAQSPTSTPLPTFVAQSADSSKSQPTFASSAQSPTTTSLPTFVAQSADSSKSQPTFADQTPDSAASQPTSAVELGKGPTYVTFTPVSNCVNKNESSPRYFMSPCPNGTVTAYSTSNSVDPTITQQPLPTNVDQPITQQPCSPKISPNVKLSSDEKGQHNIKKATSTTSPAASFTELSDNSPKNVSLDLSPSKSPIEAETQTEEALEVSFINFTPITTPGSQASNLISYHQTSTSTQFNHVYNTQNPLSPTIASTIYSAPIPMMANYQFQNQEFIPPSSSTHLSNHDGSFPIHPSFEANPLMVNPEVQSYLYTGETQFYHAPQSVQYIVAPPLVQYHDINRTPLFPIDKQQGDTSTFQTDLQNEFSTEFMDQQYYYQNQEVLFPNDLEGQDSSLYQHQDQVTGSAVSEEQALAYQDSSLYQHQATESTVFEEQATLYQDTSLYQHQPTESTALEEQASSRDAGLQGLLPRHPLLVTYMRNHALKNADITLPEREKQRNGELSCVVTSSAISGNTSNGVLNATNLDKIGCTEFPPEVLNTTTDQRAITNSAAALDSPRQKQTSNISRKKETPKTGTEFPKNCSTADLALNEQTPKVKKQSRLSEKREKLRAKEQIVEISIKFSPKPERNGEDLGNIAENLHLKKPAEKIVAAQSSNRVSASNTIDISKNTSISTNIERKESAEKTSQNIRKKSSKPAIQQQSGTEVSLQKDEVMNLSSTTEFENKAAEASMTKRKVASEVQAAGTAQPKSKAKVVQVADNAIRAVQSGSKATDKAQAGIKAVEIVQATGSEQDVKKITETPHGGIKAGAAQAGSKVVEISQVGTKPSGLAQAVKAAPGVKTAGSAQSGDKNTEIAQPGSKRAEIAKPGSKAAGVALAAAAAQADSIGLQLKHVLTAAKILNVMPNTIKVNPNIPQEENEKHLNEIRKQVELASKCLQNAQSVRGACGYSPPKPSPQKPEIKVNKSKKKSPRETRLEKKRKELRNSPLPDGNLSVDPNMVASSPTTGQIATKPPRMNCKVTLIKPESKDLMEKLMFSSNATTMKLRKGTLTKIETGQTKEVLPDAVCRTLSKHQESIRNFFLQDDSSEPKLEKTMNLLEDAKDDKPEKEDSKPELEQESSSSKKKRRKNKRK